MVKFYDCLSLKDCFTIVYIVFLTKLGLHSHFSPSMNKIASRNY